jgi:hypothetical protein
MEPLFCDSSNRQDVAAVVEAAYSNRILVVR